MNNKPSSPEDSWASPRFDPHLFRKWDRPKKGAETAKAFILRKGQVIREERAKYDSMSIHVGKHGWALPLFISRLNDKPRKYNSLEEVLQDSDRDMLWEPSTPAVMLRDGDIVPVSPSPTNRPKPDEITLRLLAWNDALMEGKAPGITLPEVTPITNTSIIANEWQNFKPFPEGVFDALSLKEGHELLEWKRRKAYILSAGHNFFGEVVLEDTVRYHEARRRHDFEMRESSLYMAGKLRDILVQIGKMFGWLARLLGISS